MLLAIFSNVFKSFNDISSYRHVIIYTISIYLNVLNIFQYNPSISMFLAFKSHSSILKEYHLILQPAMQTIQIFLLSTSGNSPNVYLFLKNILSVVTVYVCTFIF